MLFKSTAIAALLSLTKAVTLLQDGATSLTIKHDRLADGLRWSYENPWWGRYHLSPLGIEVASSDGQISGHCSICSEKIDWTG